MTSNDEKNIQQPDYELKPDYDLAQRIIDFLNELLNADRPAIAALIANRVPCNETLANHPTVQVMAQHGGFYVGFLGVLNGLCGIDDNGSGPIAADFTEKGGQKFNDLQKFILIKPE